MAPNLAGKKFDLSGLRDLKKGDAKPGPGRPRTRPIDPNWHDLKAIESYIYNSIPADHDNDKLDELIGDVREARANDDTDGYATALKSLLEFHYNSFESSNAYTSPLDLVKADRFMSPREVAKVAGFLHNKDRAGSRPKSYSDLRDELAKEVRATLPRVDAHLRALGGDWKAEGALEAIDRFKAEFEKAYRDLGVPSDEAEFRAQSKAIAKVKGMISSKENAHIVLSSSTDNAQIVLHMSTETADGSPFEPSATDVEMAAILGGIRKSRANRFNKDKIKVTALGNKTALPKEISSQIGDGDAAFTVHGTDGLFIYPKKITAVGTDMSFNPDWYSTRVNSLTAAYEHIIVHETGHLMMYKHWGSERDNGRAALIADMKRLRVTSGASQYGDQSPSENFAEQYAKYLLTGDASPEFIELLESKGLTKAQINKKWRDQYASESHSRFFSFLDKIFEDDTKQYVPEFDGPDVAEYTKGGLFGSGKAHKVARLLGFTSNKPKEIDTVPADKYRIFRAVNPTKRGSDLIDPEQLHEEYRTLDMPWYGYGIFGDGQYFSNHESTTYTFGSHTMAYSLDPTAKVYVYNNGRSNAKSIFDRSQNGGHDIVAFNYELQNSLLREVVLNEIDPDATESEIQAEISKLTKKLGLGHGVQYDASILAAIFGFQGIEVTDANGYDESYMVVLDRSMVMMPKVVKSLIHTSRNRITKT